jgi:hypothetical protein
MLKLAEKAIDELHAKAKAEGIVPVHGNGEEILRHIGRR